MTVVTLSGCTSWRAFLDWFEGQTKAMGPRGFSVMYGSHEMKQNRVRARKRTQRRGYFLPGESRNSVAEFARNREYPFLLSSVPRP